MNEYLLTFSTAGVFVLIVGFAWMAAMLIRIRLHQEQLERHEYTVWEKLSVMSENNRRSFEKLLSHGEEK